MTSTDDQDRRDPDETLKELASRLAAARLYSLVEDDGPPYGPDLQEIELLMREKSPGYQNVVREIIDGLLREHATIMPPTVQAKLNLILIELLDPDDHPLAGRGYSTVAWRFASGIDRKHRRREVIELIVDAGLALALSLSVEQGQRRAARDILAQAGQVVTDGIEDDALTQEEATPLTLRIAEATQRIGALDS